MGREHVFSAAFRDERLKRPVNTLVEIAALTTVQNAEDGEDGRTNRP